MRNFLRFVLPTIGALLVAAVVAWAADNAVIITPGIGVPMKSKDIGAGVQAMQNLLCDPTTIAQCAAVSASGAVKMDASATTQPISGAVSQSGTWTVQPGNTANTTAWKVDGSAVTQPVSAASLPLPTGGATSANQSTEITSLATIAANTGASVPAGTNLIGFVNSDPCAQAAKTNQPFTTAAGTTQIISGVSAKKIYICSLSVIVPSAVSVSLIEGSSATCGTSSTGGVIGQPLGSIGASSIGLALPANGGLTLGNGGSTVAATATAANYLCLFQSGTAQIAGNLTFVQQ